MMRPLTAHPVRRLIAYWIDITLLYAAVFALQLGVLARLPVPQQLAAAGNGLLIWGWTFLTASLPMWLYFILGERSASQATLGKRLLGLQVTDLAGRRISFGRAAWRTACKLAFFEIGHLSLFLPTPLWQDPSPSLRPGIVVLLFLMVAYFALAVMTPRRQSLHDLLAGTLVVRRAAPVRRLPAAES